MKRLAFKNGEKTSERLERFSLSFLATLYVFLPFILDFVFFLMPLTILLKNKQGLSKQVSPQLCHKTLKSSAKWNQGTATPTSQVRQCST